jgi:aminoglycoside phosphotransferase (APT) family kinase protein
MPAPRGRDFELTRKRLAEWLGDRLGSDARSLRVSPLSGPDATGFSSDTLLLDLTFERGGRQEQRGLVVRIKPTGFAVFPEYDLAKQYRVMQALGNTDVPVPRPLAFEESDALLGAPFYVMERVDGRIPTDNPPYHAGGWMAGIPPSEREAIWWSGLETLARIHRCDWEQLGLGFLAMPQWGDDPLGQQLAYYGHFLEWAGRGRPQPTCEAALDWLRAERPRGCEPVALSWGDARIGNMIFRGVRCAAVLDWEMAALASPMMDLAWFLYMDRHHSEGVGAPRLSGFPGAAESIERYAAWSGGSIGNLAFYEVFAAFRFAVIMIRVAQQMVAYGVLPEDSPFERNNTATHLLARLLELPPPGET